MRLRTYLVTLVLVTALARSAAATPKIGDKAPPVKISDWVVAKPPSVPGEAGADKHVFLVEFWATWCGPCRKSIPHLAKLHRTKEKEGLVIISVSNEDKDVVEKFIKGKGPGKGMDMPYFVGIDDDMGTNAKYMDQINGIPHAFLVDRKGLVVWAGNPLEADSLDRAIDQVLAGKYDVERAKKDAEAAKRSTKLMNELQTAFGARDEKKVFALVDELIDLKPADLQGYLIKRHMLGEFNKRDQIPALDTKMETAMKDSPADLKQIAGFLIDRDPAQRNAGLLLRSAQRADELAKGKDAEIASLLAMAYCQLGVIDAAIDAQRRALSLADQKEKDAFQAVLKYYEEAREVGKSAASKMSSSG